MSNTNNFFKTKKTWSNYKDKILSLYLKPYFQKIMKSPNRTIYIDGFAGKGKFDDGALGSPLIVRDLIKEVERNSVVKQQKIFPVFIEKKYATDLQKNINDNSCKIFCDDYKIKAKDIVSRADKFNVFMYVDPFGIKDLDFSIFTRLSQNPNSTELLLNLNSFGFIREGCRLLKAKIDSDIEENAGNYQEDSLGNNIENMNKIANGDEWQKIISEMKAGKINGKTAEKLFTNLYMKNLAQIYLYTFSIPIKTGDNLVPKYQMIFATNHIQGALIMADNMIKCDIELSAENKNGQQSLFDYVYTKNNINESILGVLSDSQEINIKDLCISLYRNAKFYLHSDIKQALRELENSKKVFINRNNIKTPTGRDYSGNDFIKYDIFIRSVK